jgi:hypothetical protein
MLYLYFCTSNSATCAADLSIYNLIYTCCTYLYKLIYIPAAPSLQVFDVLLVVTRVVAPAAHAFARARALAALATMLMTSWLLTEK